MIELVKSSGVYAIIGVVVIAVASLLGLVLFASREEKFEDVIAAQKKEREALIEYLTTSSKSSKTKKKQYKKNKKGTAKADDKAEEIDLVVEEQVLESTPPSETLPEETNDVSDLKHSKEEVQKKKKHGTKKSSKKAQKAAIVEEVISVQEEATVEASSGDLGDFEPVPEETSPKQHEWSNGYIEDMIDEMMTEDKVEQSAPTLPQSGKKSKSKKSKSSQSKKDGEIKYLTLEQLLKEFESSPLGNEEVQALIDALFDKQNELLQWQKPNQKGEVKVDYRKQVEDLQKLLEEEKKTSQLTAQKLKDMRNDLNSERSQNQSYQSQANVKMGQQTKEIQALQKRMETSHEKHLAEMQSAQTQIQRMQELIDGNSSVEVSRLKEEIAHLQKASMRVKQLMEDNQSLIGELSQVQQSNKQLRAEVDTSLSQMTAYEAEMNKLRMDKGEAENVMSKRLQEVNEQLLRSEGKNQSLTASLEAIQKELDELRNVQIEQAQQALNESATDGGDSSAIRALLDDATKEIGELKSTMKVAENKLKDAQESEDEKSKIIADLEAQLAVQQEKSASGDNSEPAKVNGIDSTEELDTADTLASLKEKEVVLKLTSDLKTAEDDLVKAKEDLEDVRKEKDEVISRMRQEIEDLNAQIANSMSQDVENLRSDVTEQQNELKKIEVIVEQLRTKNNELREKNWKAMDAVGVAEGNAKKQVKELETVTIEFLGSLHPDVRINKSEPIETVFEQYKSSLESLLTKNNNNDELESLREENKSLLTKIEDLKSAGPTADDTKVSELEEKLEKALSDEKNASLQADHYKKTLEETESMLTKLKDGVEAEVSSWKDKNQSLKAELEESQEKVLNLEASIKEVTEKVNQASTASNDSADKLSQLNEEKAALENQLTTTTEELRLVKEKCEELMKTSDASVEEVKTLQEKLKTQESSTKESSDGDKDAKIKELEEENESLLEQLKEERDRVIVDVEIPGGSREELKKDLSETKDQLETEKKSSEQLQLTVTELQEQLSSLQASVEAKDVESTEANSKIQELQDKYKVASERLAISEEKIKELENEKLSKSQQIEKEINDAMTQSTGHPDSPQREVGRPLTHVIDELKASLAEKDKVLEAEKQANRQLRVQLASLSTGGDPSHGTSV